MADLQAAPLSPLPKVQKGDFPPCGALRPSANKQLDVFYTTALHISDRLPYGDKLKVAIAKRYASSQNRMANPDYDHLQMWKRLGSGNSMKKITGFTRNPGIRVLKGCRPFLSKDDKKEIDLGYVQYFTFDIDVADKANGNNLDDNDMKAIMKVVENTIPRMEIADDFIIQDAYINRSGSATGIHLTLAVMDMYKMSITKANNIKQWLYDVVKSKFIGELNALCIDTFVMDDNANNGIKKLFFSDSQEKLRHISLVGDYNQVIGVSTPQELDNATDEGNLATDKAYKTIATAKSVDTLLNNRNIRNSINKKEIIHKGMATVKLIIGSKRGKTGYDSEVSCIVGERPSPSFWDYCEANDMERLAGVLLHIYQKHSIMYNLRNNSIPADIMKMMDEGVKSVCTRDDVIRLYNNAINMMSGVVRGKRRFIEAAKKMIKSLNLEFGYNVKECYIHRDKVHLDDDNNVILFSKVPSLKINSIIHKNVIGALSRYTEHNTFITKESDDIIGDIINPRKQRDYFTKQDEKSTSEGVFRGRKSI